MDSSRLHAAKLYGLIILVVGSTVLSAQFLFPNMFFAVEMPMAISISTINLLLAWSYYHFLSGVGIVVNEAGSHDSAINFMYYKYIAVIATLSAALVLPLGVYFGEESRELVNMVYLGIIFILGVASFLVAKGFMKIGEPYRRDAQTAALLHRISGFLFSTAFIFGSLGMFSSLIAYFFMWRMVCHRYSRLIKEAD